MIKLKSLLSENIKYHIDTRGVHHGQSDLTLQAFDEEGNQVGYITYSEFEDSPSVQMIKVHRNYRRRGIATAMLKKLQSLYPDVEINLGMSVGSGDKFLSSKKLGFTYVPNEEHKKLTDRLSHLQAMEKKLNTWIENQDKPLKRMPKITDIYNRISDEIWDIEQKLSRMKPGKNLVNYDKA